MEPAAFPLNSGQLIAAVTGCLLVLVLVLVSLWLKRWRSESQRERSPQREKLLRPPGYSCARRIARLEDRLIGALAVALAAAVIFGVIGGTLYPVPLGVAQGRFTLRDISEMPESDQLTRTSLIAFGALLLCVGTVGWVLRLDDEARSTRFGLRAEQVVAEKLGSRELSAAGYVVFHDVPGNGTWNINHVVVGPGGVLVLETKARPRRAATRPQPEQEVLFDGQELQFPYAVDWRAAGQVERNARWVRDFLTGSAPTDLPIHPLIVVPGWTVKSYGNSPVKVVNADELGTYVAAMNPLFTKEQLEPVIRKLDERCRDLEF